MSYTCQHYDWYLEKIDKGKYILVLKRCKLCNEVIDQWQTPK